MANKSENNKTENTSKELAVRNKIELVKKQKNLPDKKKDKDESRPNWFVRAYNYIARKLKEMQSELKKVTWPTPKFAWKQTAVVIVVVLFFLVVLMGIDLIFANLLEWLVSKGA